MRTSKVKRTVMVLMFPAAALVDVLDARAQAAGSIFNPFGQCAQQSNLVVKVAACEVAAKSTPYPWILQWVYRERARAHRELGEVDSAIVYFEKSLQAKEDAGVRQEMEALTPRVTRKTPGEKRAGR